MLHVIVCMRWGQSFEFVIYDFVEVTAKGHPVTLRVNTVTLRVNTVTLRVAAEGKGQKMTKTTFTQGLGS